MAKPAKPQMATLPHVVDKAEQPEQERSSGQKSGEIRRHKRKKSDKINQ